MAEPKKPVAGFQARNACSNKIRWTRRGTHSRALQSSHSHPQRCLREWRRQLPQESRACLLERAPVDNVTRRTSALDSFNVCKILDARVASSSNLVGQEIGSVSDGVVVDRRRSSRAERRHARRRFSPVAFVDIRREDHQPVTPTLCCCLCERYRPPWSSRTGNHGGLAAERIDAHRRRIVCFSSK